MKPFLANRQSVGDQSIKRKFASSQFANMQEARKQSDKKHSADERNFSRKTQDREFIIMEPHMKKPTLTENL